MLGYYVWHLISMRSVGKLRVVPITFAEASAFVGKYHRHNKPPVGCKFCVAVEDDSGLRGVAQCGRPIARMLDDKRTIEINRTCTDGCKNANSMLYGACRAVAKALGYRRIITYIQSNETGASLRAVGFVKVHDMPARKSWEASSGPQHKGTRTVDYAGGVARSLWEVVFAGKGW